jgi:hypothetical protein
LLLPPGAVLVLGGVEADAAQAVLVRRLPEGISNGLGNGGDRLSLATEDGRLLDALSYGSDATFADGAPPAPAPGAGHSIQRVFADDGSLLRTVISDVPSPGRIEAPRDRGPDPSAPGAEASGGALNRTWIVLGGLASALLLAAGAARVWAVVRADRD